MKGWLGLFLSNNGVLAKVSSSYPLPLRDVDDYIVTFIKSLAPSLLEESLWMLALPGKGKTPLARITAMLHF